MSDQIEEEFDGMKETLNVTLSNILELLDPISSTVQSYSIAEQPKKYLSNARRKFKSSRTHQKLTKLKSSAQDFSPQLEEFKRKTLLKLQSIDKPLESIFFQNSSNLEKSFYPFTLFNIFVIGFIMGKYPEWFHVYYTVLFVLLMPCLLYTSRCV